MDTAWVSSDPALQVSADSDVFVGPGPASNRFEATSGALGVTATFLPPGSLDLSEFEELRFWVRASRPADGSHGGPFYLEFSYSDTNDAAGETHRWFVPVNRAETWEQRRIGIEEDRRSMIERMEFRCVSGARFICYVDELLAVSEEMLADLERELDGALSKDLRLPGLADIDLHAPAGSGSQTIVVPLTPGFAVGNRILVTGGAAGSELHDVTQVTDDGAAGTTTLQFAPTDTVVGNLAVGSALVSVLAPVLFESPPAATPAVVPAIVVTPLGIGDDQRRSGKYVQRDSFRLRGAVTVCSTRPSARAYVIDYQLTAIGTIRAQQRFLYEEIVRRLSPDTNLRINGAPAPVSFVESPQPPGDRPLGLPEPVYVRIGTRLEVEPRREQVWVGRLAVEAGRIEAPEDLEEIVVEL
jgi:hypothetical protein